MGVRGYAEASASECFGAPKDWLSLPALSAAPARPGDVRWSAERRAGR